MSKFKIGLIGLGKMGTYHMNLCEEINEVELVSVCDIDMKRIDIFKDISN